MMKTKTWTDPIVDEVRGHREAIFREAGYDLRVLCERLMEKQKRHGKRLVSAKKNSGEAENE